MLSNYFDKKHVLRGTFGEIWRIQIQFYPKPYVELKYGACILKNEVSAHRLGFSGPTELKSNRSSHLGIHKQTNACWSLALYINSLAEE